MRTTDTLITLRTEHPVVFEIVAERARQDAKWGIQDHDPFCWLAVLGEEFGEASQAALDLRFTADPPHDYRAELVQVAAVALAMIECFDRGTWRWGDAVKTVTP